MADTNVVKGLEADLLAIKKGAALALGTGKLNVGDTAYDQGTLVKKCDEMLAPFQKVHDARSLEEESRADREKSVPDARTFVRAVKHAAEAKWGETSVEFSQLGFKPPKKRAELTPEQKQLKVERLRATRAARHVMGSRQRKAVKGEVGPTPSPATPEKPATGTTPPTTGGHPTAK